MGLSIFLAKLLGSYMLIVALISLVRKDQFHKVANSIMSSEGLLAISGIINLVSGLAIVIGHPVWDLNWRGLITLIGIIAIVQGVARLGFADQIKKKYSSEKLEKAHWFIVGVLVVLGAVLTYSGFSRM